MENNEEYIKNRSIGLKRYSKVIKRKLNELYEVNND
jgi:hypothetical protein